MTKNLVNCCMMTQNNVLALFIFLNFVLEILFWGNFGPESSKPLFKMKLDTEGYSRLLILNSTNIFLNFIPEIPFLSNLVPKLQSSMF